MKIPKVYETVTFDTLQGKYLDNAKKYLKEFVNNPQGNILLTGGVGTGKTALLYAFYKEWSSTHQKETEYHSSGLWLPPEKGIYITSLKSVMDTIKASWNNKTWNSTYELLKNVFVLLIDEVGLQYGSESERIELYELFNYRWENQLPIIATSNLDRELLMQKLGSRICDRLFSGCKFFVFNQESKR